MTCRSGLHPLALRCLNPQALHLPQVMKLLLAEKERSHAAGWRSFQGACQTLKLQRTRALGEARELEAAIDAAARAARLQAAEAEIGVPLSVHHNRPLNPCLVPDPNPTHMSVHTVTGLKAGVRCNHFQSVLMC